MEREPLIVLGVLLGLLAVAGVARRVVAPGWQKNALSVALVVVGLLAAFTVFFAFGELMRSSQSQAKPKVGAVVLPAPGNQAAPEEALARFLGVVS